MHVTGAVHLQPRPVDRATSDPTRPVLTDESSGLAQALVIGGGVALLAGVSATASFATSGRGTAMWCGVAAALTGAAALMSGAVIG